MPSKDVLSSLLSHYDAELLQSLLQPSGFCELPAWLGSALYRSSGVPLQTLSRNCSQFMPGLSWLGLKRLCKSVVVFRWYRWCYRSQCDSCRISCILTLVLSSWLGWALKTQLVLPGLGWVMFCTAPAWLLLKMAGLNHGVVLGCEVMNRTLDKELGVL